MFFFAPFGEVTLGHTYAASMVTHTRLIALAQFFALAVYLGAVLYLCRPGRVRPG